MKSDSGESSASHPPSRSPSGAFEATSAGTEKTHLPPAPEGKYLAVLTLGALGVVFGDIGTSPLYALRECFAGHHPIPPTPGNVLGILSLIFWALVLTISIQYLAIVLRADNRGEGGILALMALLRPSPEKRAGGGFLIVAVGLFGAALLYGDSIITPAITVLSSIEGLSIVTPAFDPYIRPIAVVVLLALFSLQKKGTAGMGAIFGPIMLVWFAVLASLGVVHIVTAPKVLAAVNPLHAVRFFGENGVVGFLLLGAVFLHFFLLFPRRKVFRFAEARPGEEPPAAPLVLLQRFLNGSPALFVILYTLPPAFYALQMAVLRKSGDRSALVYGAPRANWILLADYLVLGLLALAHSWWTAREKTTRRPILVLLLGTLGGIVPFVLFAVYFPSLFRDERYLAWGVVPMALVPLTFAYAIVRFRLFDVQVIVGKSIVYAILTAIVTGLYALAVVAGNALVSSRTLSPLFAFAFGLAVVLLVDPLRRRMQAVVDRVFFRDRADFQSAFRDISRQVVAQLDRGVHAIGKKIVEEAAEVWMAAEYESDEAAAEEISQLIYHLQVLMLAKGLTPADVYRHL